MTGRYIFRSVVHYMYVFKMGILEYTWYTYIYMYRVIVFCKLLLFLFYTVPILEYIFKAR